MRPFKGGPTTIRIFVASPGDVVEERDILGRAVNELNRGFELFNKKQRVHIKLLRYEDLHPGAGRPEEVILQQIGEYDIFIGLMWRRFGTPTGKEDSGTAEEYLQAYDRWQAQKRPQMLFYFSTAAAPPPATVDEAQQLLQVVTFRTEVEKKQLIAQYNGPRDFDRFIRFHLLGVIEKELQWPDAKAALSKHERRRQHEREEVLENARRDFAHLSDSPPQ